MNLLYALESVRTPFWDAVFSAVTHLGEETVFMVAAILIFWCVSKQEGYYLLLMGFFGTVVNQFLKLLFRIPRPWVRDPDFTIVESARAQRDSYADQVAELQQENDALKEDIAEGVTPEKIEEIARDELGYVTPGEYVFYDTSN